MATITHTDNELQTLRKRLLSAFDVRSFGAKGDGKRDDSEAIQAAINAASAIGGGTVFVPNGDYCVSRPIDLATGVNLTGDNQASTTIRKSSNTPNDDGVDAVLSGLNCNRFQVSNLRLVGNRKAGNCDGINLNRCSYFSVSHVRSQMCNVGAALQTSFCGSLEHVVSERCQGYGFYLHDACTSLTLQNCTAWGTGGAFKLVGCIYSTLISPACDHSDAGGRPDDPFGGESGGDYLNPSHIFYVAASSVTILSPGTENGYSQYLYAEGANVVMINPYVYNLQCHSAPWRFIELRGTGASNVEIVNPAFHSVANMASPAFNRNGVFVESPSVQQVTFSRVPKISDSFGEYEYSADGICEIQSRPFNK
jgi:hypothetical protein